MPNERKIYAFPSPGTTGWNNQSGISRVGYYAAAALTGELACQNKYNGEWTKSSEDELVELCFRIGSKMAEAEEQWVPI